MKKAMLFLMTAVLICTVTVCAGADCWDYGWYSTVQAKLTEDLATRSGPATGYTGCGSYRMKGQTVTVISRAFDIGGVQWAQVEISYGGALRRMYTGVKRLNISNSQLASIREENMYSVLGYGTICGNINPKWGPGSYYCTYTDRVLNNGTNVTVLAYENGYYQIECYHYTGELFRCWVPAENIYLN